MNVYHITVYLEDDDDLEDEPSSYQMTLSAREIGSVRMKARSETEAAAKAWVRLAGIARERTLLKLRAPHPLIAEQTNIREIAAQIEACDVWCGQLKLTNQVETWYFRVE